MSISPLRSYRLLMVGLFTLLGVMGLWLPAQIEVALASPSSTITVNSPADVLADDGVCTLREAITAANTDTPSGATTGECIAGNGADTIVFSDTNAPFTVTLAITGTREDGNATGDLDIFSDVTIQGNPAFTTTIDANRLDRVLDVLTGTVSLEYLRIVNGNPPECIEGYPPSTSIPGEPGGGIRNIGSLHLNFVVVFRNQGANGSTCPGEGTGGGIWNSGLMEIWFTTIISNHAGDNWFFKETGGSGGGIYNRGNLTIVDSNIIGNRAGNVSYHFYNSESGGGHGGGIYNTGNLVITDSAILSNRGGIGADGNFDPQQTPGKGGNGGGIYNTGVTTISGSTFSENHAGRGGNGGYGIPESANGGTGGSGGAVFVVSNTVTIINSTLDRNSAGGGGRGAPGIHYSEIIYLDPGIGGNAGHGGAIALLNPTTVHIVNSTIFGNVAPIGAEGGICAWGCLPAGPGENGSGGAIHGSGQITINNSTISMNKAHHQGGAFYIQDIPSNASGMTITHSTIVSNSAIHSVGGIKNINSIITLSNTIIGANDAPQNPDCAGMIQSNGYLLLENSEGCGITELNPVGNIYGHPPLVLPLTNNGGDTLTHALDVHSPALDAGNCPPNSTDQRGEPRPFDIVPLPNIGNGCDIGAYEAQDPQNVPTRTPTSIPTITPTPTIIPTQPPTLYLPLIQRNQQPDRR